MRERLLTLMMAFLYLTAFADEPLRYLWVWKSNGDKMACDLTEKPQVTFSESSLVITQNGTSKSFPMEDVIRFTYESWLPGDANKDGKVNVADITATINNITGRKPAIFSVKNADVSGNDIVDFDDVVGMTDIIFNKNRYNSSNSPQNAGNVSYVYRNDGQFDAFFRDKVQSIEYSNEDADGNAYDNIVTQVVNTADSIYKIPLAAIDSIGFIQPKVIVNDKVYTLTAAHSSYVLQANTNSFILSKNTPELLQPQQGHIVVSTYDCLSFPDGIMARVISRIEQSDGIHYECEQASIDDVYDQIVYYGYGNIFDQSRNLARTRAEARASGILWDRTIDGNVNYSGTSSTLSNHTKGAFEIVLRKTLGNPIYARIIFGNEITSTFSFSAKSEADIKPEPKQLGNTIVAGRIIIPEFPLIWFEPQMKLFGYFEEIGSVSIDLSAHYKRLDRFELTCCDKKWTFNHTTPVSESSIDVASLSMKGYAEIGIQPEIMISLNGCPTGIGFSTRIGLRESVDFKFDALTYFDEGMYESIKDCKTKESVTLSGSIFAKLGIIEKDCMRGEYTIAKKEIPISSHYLLPTFTELSSIKVKDKTNAYVVSTSINRDLLLPVSLGFGLFDDGGHLLQTKYSDQSYRLEKDWTLNGLAQTFDNIISDKKYSCSPMVKFFNIELRATPSVDINTGFPVKISEFKQTDSKYEKDAFTNDSKKYSYKYDCAVTVELTDSKNVEDWGYVYEDPEGQVALISLKEFGNSYTDNRYVYYRNEATSICTLYVYVKYLGDDDYYYGEPQDYALVYEEESFCPDDNHPHIIDLGLPSGTKWACCNVGALKPEDYGGYYAWGETSEKSIYVPSNYSFSEVGGNNPLWYTHNGEDHYICEENGVCYSLLDIGECISGTKYDAAYVNWGTAWQMPTWDAIWEMVCSCSSEWTELNGVLGRLYTGMNGNKIFMPNGGYKDDIPNPFDNNNKFNTEGYYWSGTLYEYLRFFYAKELVIGASYGDNSGANLRYRGQAIRPVAR